MGEEEVATKKGRRMIACSGQLKPIIELVKIYLILFENYLLGQYHLKFTQVLCLNLNHSCYLISSFCCVGCPNLVG